MPSPVTLAIDTGQPRCQCAVALAGGETSSIAEDRERGHAEALIGQVEALLARAGIDFADLERVAVTTGPGSFTGLRVGLSAARAFALALDIPVLGIPTMLALSLAGQPGAPLSVLVDARRGEVWCQRFAGPGNPARGPERLPLAVALSRLAAGGMVIGSAAPIATEAAAAAGLELEVPAGPVVFADIEAVARFAQSADPAEFPPEPLYLRPPDARSQASKRVARQ
jgi:tRNA threonylcarbamoyladenosine biosynthesis protein TsaB